MNIVNNQNWQQLNHHYLVNSLAKIRLALEGKIKGESFTDDAFLSTFSSSSPPALERFKKNFCLTTFECNILLLCAGMEFYSSWDNLCAEAQNDARKTYPTFSLALSIFPESDWNALTPFAPLRKWRLIELDVSNSLSSSPIKLNERILHYLTGIQYLDEYLENLSFSQFKNQNYNDNLLITSQQEIVEQISNLWLTQSSLHLVIELAGGDSFSKKAIAFLAIQKLQFNIYEISAQKIPEDLTLLKCLCEREWLLSQNVLLLDCEELEKGNNSLKIQTFIDSIKSPLIIISSEHFLQVKRPLITFNMTQPSYEEQKKQWQLNLGKINHNLNGNLDLLLSNFNLTIPEINKAFYNFQTLTEEQRNISNLWKICRHQNRPRLDDLCQRINLLATWDDLIIAQQEQDILHEIAAHLRQRIKVYQEWGWQKKSSRGLGISALFAGASGTGKTMAAEVIGNELNLDVYRIDLSSVVSKYIGETEKNLKKIFDAAESCGAILLFDEADALFGKRSEVKDSHDRYANMEVSYLLQRIESYQGLAILTSNFKNAIDQAFLRRIRFIVQFAFPNANQREAIWQRIFPSQTPTQNLDYKKLGKLNVAGGNIRNIALNAAFIAADEGQEVQMKHILQASQSEYSKLERPLTDGEVKGWV